MNRTIEANFFPQVVEPIKEKARILIIDNNRDLTRRHEQPLRTISVTTVSL
jgi:hypothetical protein